MRSKMRNQNRHHYRCHWMTRKMHQTNYRRHYCHHRRYHHYYDDYSSTQSFASHSSCRHHSPSSMHAQYSNPDCARRYESMSPSLVAYVRRRADAHCRLRWSKSKQRKSNEQSRACAWTDAHWTRTEDEMRMRMTTMATLPPLMMTMVDEHDASDVDYYRFY